MKLDPNAAIATEKITRYLLVPQARGDKSSYLAMAGYTQVTADLLASDLKTQLLESDAEYLERTQFGTIYQIVGLLNGPNGMQLRVRTEETSTGITKFVTLIPEKRVRDI